VRSGPGRRILRLAVLPLLLTLAVGAGSEKTRGQDPPVAPRAGTGSEVRAVFAVVPDTVRVGEPFLLGVAVRTGPDARVRFPEQLPTGEWYEQRGPVETARPEPDVWRADYTLVAWRAEPGPVPSFEVELSSDGEARRVTLRPPEPVVGSVLPPRGEEELDLRPPKPFVDEGWPFWLLALLLAALPGALLLWWHARRRAAARAVQVEGASDEALGPREKARVELEALVRLDEVGRIEEDAFYDRLEAVVRSYAEATHDWAPGVPIRLVADGDGELAEVFHRSALSRFAAIRAGKEARSHAAKVVDRWIEEDS